MAWISFNRTTNSNKIENIVLDDQKSRELRRIRTTGLAVYFTVAHKGDTDFFHRNLLTCDRNLLTCDRCLITCDRNLITCDRNLITSSQSQILLAECCRKWREKYAKALCYSADWKLW